MVAPTNETNESSDITSESQFKERIRTKTDERVAKYANANLRDLTYRLVELDREWSVERVMELGFSGVVLGGIGLSRLSNRRWIVFPCLAAGFMMQQIFAGWCPPFLVLRRLGFRTAAEINRERMALKIIRGDFAHLGVPSSKEALASQSSLVDALEQ
jgi:hypothetical protein